MFALILFPLVRDKDVEAKMSAENQKYVNDMIGFGTSFILLGIVVGILIGEHHGKTGKFF